MMFKVIATNNSDDTFKDSKGECRIVACESELMSEVKEIQLQDELVKEHYPENCSVM